MARRKLSSEERREKQKAELNLETSVTTQYKKEPNLKDTVVAAALKKGFACTYKNSIVCFSNKLTEEEKAKVESWLLDEFGKMYERDKGQTKEIPFSFGYTNLSGIDIEVPTEETEELALNDEEEREI